MHCNPCGEDNCAFCSEASDLGKEIKALEQRLIDAEKVIGFYGDCDNWLWQNHEYSTIREELEDTRGHEFYGGKRARQYQEKYKEK